MEHSHPNGSQVISIDRSHRWQVFHRLQELNISCNCLSDGTLQAQMNTPVAIVQVQSVVQQFTASRQTLVSQLERCWSLPAFPNR